MNKIRSVLEWISVPFFIFLVVHMGGHGVFSLAGGHDHAHDSHDGHSPLEHFFEILLEGEVLAGILLLILFAWLWHRPTLAKLVPCRHSGCHHASPWPHMLATAAFVLHFFPEAYLRANSMESPESLISMAGLVAFGAHFIIDIIVAAALSLYWKNFGQKTLSFTLIVGFWILAYFLASRQVELFHFEGIMSIIGAFLLSMFVHWPNHTTHTHE